MKLSSNANLYLVIATLMWGITFPLTRNALTEVDPFVFVSLRFALAAIVLFPFVWPFLYKTTRPMLIGSFIIAIFNAVAYLSQTIGLVTVNSARAAFITGASVVLVPFLAPLFKLGRPSAIDLLCALIGFLGLYILADLQHHQATSGDIWIFCSAIGFSFQITYLQRLTQIIPDGALITFYQLLFSATLGLFFAVGHDYRQALQTQALTGILFCAVFATSLAYYLQNKYQKFTSATKAVLIFALEPLFASLFGFLINHELLNKATIYGGLLLLLSLILPGLVSLARESILLLNNDGD